MRNSNLTTSEKKEMYNRIMESASQMVIKMLNEAYGGKFGRAIKEKIVAISKANPNHTVLIKISHSPYAISSWCKNGKFSESGGTGAIRLISQLPDDCFDGKIIYKNAIDLEKLPDYASDEHKKEYNDLYNYPQGSQQRNKRIKEMHERFQYITVWLVHENLENSICVLFAKLKNYDKIDQIREEIGIKLSKRQQRDNDAYRAKEEKAKKREETLQMLRKKAASNISLPDSTDDGNLFSSEDDYIQQKEKERKLAAQKQEEERKRNEELEAQRKAHNEEVRKRMYQKNPQLEIFDKIRKLSDEEKQKVFDEQFTPERSNKQCEKYPDTFSIKDNKVYMTITIQDDNTDEIKKIQLSGKSYGDVLRKYDILTNATVIDLSGDFFKITTDNHGVFCWRVFRLLASEKYLDKLEDIIDDCYDQVISESKTIDELLSKLKKFKF